MDRLDSYVLTFGKYKGHMIGEVPAGYLLWLAEQKWIGRFPEIVEYVGAKRDQLEQEYSGNIG